MEQPPDDGQIIAAFQEMLISHSRASYAHKIFDDLRKAKRLSPFTPQSWVAFFAVSFSGKSRSVELYMNKVVDCAIASGRFPDWLKRHEVERAQMTVLRVSLPSSNVRPKVLITMLLERLGDPLPEKGNTSQQLQRLYDLMRKLGTELIIIDEMQHLSAAMREYSRRPTGESPTSIPYLIKTILDNGQVPIVCIGIPPGKAHMMSNDEIRNRCYKQIDFPPISADSPEMLDVFVKYFGLVSYEIVERGLFPDLSDFISEDIPDCLLDVSGGILGNATILIRDACSSAAGRHARCVEYRDLEATTDDFIAAGKSMVKVNPFRERRLAKEAQIMAS